MMMMIKWHTTRLVCYAIPQCLGPSHPTSSSQHFTTFRATFIPLDFCRQRYRQKAPPQDNVSVCPQDSPHPNPATPAPSSVPERSPRRAQTMFSGPPSTASFVERELMDPHNIMESGSTLNGLRDQSLDSTLDFLKQPVDMGVRPLAPSRPVIRLFCPRRLGSLASCVWPDIHHGG